MTAEGGMDEVKTDTAENENNSTEENRCQYFKIRLESTSLIRDCETSNDNYAQFEKKYLDQGKHLCLIELPSTISKYRYEIYGNKGTRKVGETILESNDEEPAENILNFMMKKGEIYFLRIMAYWEDDCLEFTHFLNIETKSAITQKTEKIISTNWKQTIREKNLAILNKMEAKVEKPVADETLAVVTTTSTSAPATKCLFNDQQKAFGDFWANKSATAGSPPAYQTYQSKVTYGAGFNKNNFSLSRSDEKEDAIATLFENQPITAA